MAETHVKRPSRGRLLSVALVIVGAAGIFVGIVLLAIPEQSSFGWTAYVPLSTTTFSPIGSKLDIVGLVLIAVGLVALSLRLGMLIGSRTAMRRD